MNDIKPAPRVLIVDDDDDLSKVLLRSLRVEGYEAVGSSTAEEALALAMSGTYEIILTDINLPGMEGLALLAKIKNLIPSCDVIMMTGDPTLENAVKAMGAGAYDFLIKPFSNETLFFTLKRCIEKRSLSSEMQTIKAYQEELSSAYSQLKSLDRMKDSFLSTIGHELKTPLTPIIGGLELLAAGTDRAIPPEIINGMRRGAARLEEIIDDLLAYAGMKSEKEPSQCGPAAIMEIVQRAVEEILPKASELGIVIRAEYPSTKAVVSGDRGRIFLAVKSLIRNAVFFNRPQGSVCVEVRETPTGVSIRVEDTGEGIPQEYLKSIYDPFYQVADYLTRKRGGLGLGLAIVKQAAESHKGHVKVSSIPGKGSVFTLILPKDGCVTGA
ncbi:MAG: Response regulator receiver sensor signal transduction histidine kinase [Parcubacteria group bacterium GW2011_GWF2_45_11]|nr:MAG: Response regulator receiver sensor signal transduction histidine kinase [Parcubacteria group bacterium GW2011_GWF2_45_11]